MQVLHSTKALASYGVTKGAKNLLELVPFASSIGPAVSTLPSASPLLSSPEHGLVGHSLGSCSLAIAACTGRAGQGDTSWLACTLLAWALDGLPILVSVSPAGCGRAARPGWSPLSCSHAGLTAGLLAAV